MNLRIKSPGPLQGEITVPGDKSVSHRALILGALAEGETIVEGFLHSDDCLATAECLRAMGVDVSVSTSLVSVQGVGLWGLCEPEDVLNAGNSGTTARLLLGVLSAQNFCAAITGDESLRRRPMDRVTMPLREMGAKFCGRAENKLLPITVSGGSLKPITYRMPVSSAQVKSAILLAGLFADGVTSVTEPSATRDHTERMLAAFGAQVERNGFRAAVTGRPVLRGRLVHVPGDISSAAFFLVAASIVPGSDLLLKNVGINPTRAGILDVMAEMGADMEIINRREESGEPVADIRVRYAPLKGVKIAGSMIPRLIDELPVLSVAALFAEGETEICDAAELRVKETDRIAAMTKELTALGANVEAREDGLIVRPGPFAGGTQVASHNDHRVAMALGVAALGAHKPVALNGAACVDVSYPGFWQELNRISQGEAVE